MKFLIYISAILAVVSGLRYDRYRLLEVIPNTKNNFELLNQFQDDPEFDVWVEGRGLADPQKILLSPNAYLKYTKIFEANKMQFKIVERNIQKYIDLETMSMKASARSKGSIVGTYARHEQVNQYLDAVSEQNPEFLSTYIAGNTFEERELKVLRFKTANTSRNVWINCGIHAREWVTIAACTHFIDKLINEYKNNNIEIVNILNYYEIHVLPIANPDGYEFSHKSQRLWRKNRRVNAPRQCVGVDLNRNFPANWMTGGASQNLCSDVYAGSSAGSELESQALMNIINAQPGKWDAFFDIHSFGLWYLMPFGNTAERPADYDEMLRVAKISANMMTSYNGSVFKIGSTADILYVASGSSIDWAYGENGIKYSYTLELRPDHSNSVSGFLLPEPEAIHACEETYLGLVAVFKEAMKL